VKLQPVKAQGQVTNGDEADPVDRSLTSSLAKHPSTPYVSSLWTSSSRCSIQRVMNCQRGGSTSTGLWTASGLERRQRTGFRIGWRQHTSAALGIMTCQESKSSNLARFLPDFCALSLQRGPRHRRSFTTVSLQMSTQMRAVRDHRPRKHIFELL